MVTGDGNPIKPKENLKGYISVHEKFEPNHRGYCSSRALMAA
jgi:hypothetical protein